MSREKSSLCLAACSVIRTPSQRMEAAAPPPAAAAVAAAAMRLLPPQLQTGAGALGPFASSPGLASQGPFARHGQQEKVTWERHELL